MPRPITVCECVREVKPNQIDDQFFLFLYILLVKRRNGHGASNWVCENLMDVWSFLSRPVPFASVSIFVNLFEIETKMPAVTAQAHSNGLVQYANAKMRLTATFK